MRAEFQDPATGEWIDLGATPQLTESALIESARTERKALPKLGPIVLEAKMEPEGAKLFRQIIEQAIEADDHKRAITRLQEAAVAYHMLARKHPMQYALASAIGRRQLLGRIARGQRILTLT